MAVLMSCVSIYSETRQDIRKAALTVPRRFYVRDDVYQAQSLVGCIVSHGVFNALSVFSNEAEASPHVRVLTALLLALITGAYALYLAQSVKKSFVEGGGDSPEAQ